MTKKDQTKETKYKELLEAIETMSVLELSGFVKVLEERFGVSQTTTAMPVAAAPAPGASEPPVAQKTSFNVVLKSAGGSKIQVIKLVKEITGKGLTEAKEMTEKTPSLIKEGVEKAQAEELKKKLEEAGATIALE